MTHERQLPKEIAQHIESFKLSAGERQAEVDAYWAIMNLIENASDPFVKRVHLQTLEYVLDHGSMRWTYCMDNVFPIALADQRKALKRLRPAELFKAIEHILSAATHTSNFGASRRWPLQTSAYYSMSKKLPRYGDLMEQALPLDLLGSIYRFGVHSFHVGRVVEEIIRLIEKRYDLDFAALEKQRSAKVKQK